MCSSFHIIYSLTGPGPGRAIPGAGAGAGPGAGPGAGTIQRLTLRICVRGLQLIMQISSIVILSFYLNYV